MVCVDLVGPFTIKPQISQQHPSRICFITHGWHVTRDLNLLSLTMGSIGKLKCEFKQMCEQDNYGIKAKPTTSHKPQANAIIERVHKVVVCQ
jgi:uncharacterized SAM-binding protein YcdF (DUF218 family)